MKIITSFITLLSIIFIFSGCNTKERNDASLDGLWRSVEKKKIMKIESGKYEIYDLSEGLCDTEERGNISVLIAKACLNNGVLTIEDGKIPCKYKRTNELPPECQNKNTQKEFIPLLTASLQTVYFQYFR